MSISEEVVKGVSRSFLGYLHLGSWLHQRLRSIVAGTNLVDLTSVEHFWHGVATESIHHGDHVRFRDAFVCEWLPRLPGAAWTGRVASRDMAKLRAGSLRAGMGHGLYDNPLGVVRLPFGADDVDYAALSLTTTDAWYCELGIPVLASQAVYDAFLARRIRNHAVAADLRGVVCFGRIPRIDGDLLSTLALPDDAAVFKQILTPTGMPDVYIRLTSPLDVTFKSNDTHPPGLLWCISRKTPEEQASGTLGGHYDIYFNVHFPADLSDPEAVEQCARAFGSEHLCISSTQEEGLQIRGLPGGTAEVLTEFDGRHRHFGSSIPLAYRPWQNQQALPEIRKTLIDLRNQLEFFQDHVGE